MEEAIIIISLMLLIGFGLILLFVYIIDSKYEKEKQRLDEEGAEIRILYICDRRKCDNCREECLHCSDVEHAKNFEKIGETFWEKEN